LKVIKAIIIKTHPYGSRDSSGKKPALKN